MRAKPNSSTRSGKSNRPTGKPGGNAKGVVKNSKDSGKKIIPDLSVLRQPVDTSICGLKQAVKVFETGTPEVLHLLTYDCDVVYECKVCRNLFRSIANFISHKRVYCTVRYSRSQDLLRSNKEAEDCTVILGEKSTVKLPTRITARKDLTSIVESLSGHDSAPRFDSEAGEKSAGNKATALHLEPIENSSFGVFQTVLKPDTQDLMRKQVTELQNLLSQNEVILGPDGRILQNGLSGLLHREADVNTNDENGLTCTICNMKFAHRKTLAKHKKISHKSVRTTYSCPCCKNYFANPWSVYRHLYKVHRKTNEQVRRLRTQIQKKDIKIDKVEVNNIINKKVASTNKKKADADHHLRIQQDNKEWINHLEDNWELQRCGGCGRKFERKAALISHSQICQKRIAACNKIEQNHHSSVENNSAPEVAYNPITYSKKPIPKQSPEKKIGIQVRMNYCKNSSTCNGLTSHLSSRQRSSSRSVLGDESDIDTVSADGKDPFFHQGLVKTCDTKETSILERLSKNTSKSRVAEGVDKVSSYLNNTVNRIEKVNSYEISTCKRATILRHNVRGIKSLRLEAKCLQLRSAIENGVTETVSNEMKDKETENSYFDGNVDNTSESNTSAVSSLSSQLTPVTDKTYGCELEQSEEIKNINISRTVENLPTTEADSTSMSNGGLHMTYNNQTYKENIKFFQNCDAACEEVSTSVISDEIPREDSNINVDSSCLNDYEVSVNLKPIGFEEHEPKNCTDENELENTISILTRNQLKAICKDDLLPAISDKNVSLEIVKDEEAHYGVRAATSEILKNKLSEYIIERKNRPTCSICNKIFKRAKDAIQHVPIHTRWKRYECLLNGCTYQSFWRKSCLVHTQKHTTENGKKSPTSLLGVMNPSRWNLEMLDKPMKSAKSKTVEKLVVARRNDSTPRKLVKTVNRLSKKSLSVNKSSLVENKKLQSKFNTKNEPKRKKIIKLLTKVNKQKLMTDFKTFSSIKRTNVEKNSQLKKIENKTKKSINRRVPVDNAPILKIKISPIDNVSVNEVSPSSSESNASKGRNSRASSRKSSVNSVDQLKVKSGNAVIKAEDSDITNSSLVNHESNTSKGRGSRASSRKSSVSSVDQVKGKNSNAVTKVEDSNTPLPSLVNHESQSIIHIQSPEIFDGSSSQEEEESHEPDRQVDDSHLKKIFMEVIFGPQTNQVSMPGRPVRNKTRPKRDNDFILGSQKDGDKETVEDKSNSSKRGVKTLTDSKSLPEISRKSK